MEGIDFAYDKDIELEVFDKVNDLIGDYVRQGYGPEAFRAVCYSVASNTRTMATVSRVNLEQTMEVYFNLIADTIYKSLEQ